MSKDLGEPHTTDYCKRCGESPESGTHMLPGHGHLYEDPRIRPTYKIIRTSNFDHEDHRGNQWVAAENIPTSQLAELMVNGINNHLEKEFDCEQEDFFVVVDQAHVLRPDWEP